jgi:IclR family acetate operon transcriptional repressor
LLQAGFIYLEFGGRLPLSSYNEGKLTFRFPTVSTSAGQAAQRAKAVREKQDPYFAQVIGKAFKTLDVLRRAGQPVSLNEMAQRLEGAKSSAFQFLHTLQAPGHIEKDALGRYSLSAELRTRERAPFLAGLMHAGMEKLKELKRELRETSALAALFDNHIEVVGVVESPQLIHMSNMVGRILPPHASSLGKSIAAFPAEDRQDRLLRTYGIYRY